MKSKHYYMLALIFLLTIVTVTSAWGEMPRRIQQQPAPSGQPAVNIKSNSPLQNQSIPNPNAQPKGTITIMMPADGNSTWYTTGYYPIQWRCDGTTQNLGNVSLWKDGQQVAVIDKGVVTGRTAYKVPVGTAEGIYEIRVTGNDNRVEARQKVRISAASISITAPGGNYVLATGSTYPIFWKYTGNPGPLKIELTTASGSPMLIADNVPIGNLGEGQYDWNLPDFVSPASNYKIKITSMAGGAINAASPLLTIAHPSITITQPAGGATYSPGASVPIRWNYLGKNLGSTVRIKATLVNNSGGPILDIQSAIGNNGSGSYGQWVPPTLSASAQYKIRVESVQNSAVFGELSNPISVSAPQTAAPSQGAALSQSSLGAASAGQTQSSPASAAATNPVMDKAEIIFETTDENKDIDTAIDVAVKRRNDGMALATGPGLAGFGLGKEFKANSSSGSINLLFPPGIFHKSDCRDLVLRVGIRTSPLPGKSDTWRFKSKVILHFNDGTTVTKTSYGVNELSVSWTDPFKYVDVSGPTTMN